MRTDQYGRRYTGWQSGHDDLVDPTPGVLSTRLAPLGNLLNAQRGNAGSRWCTDPQAYRTHITTGLEVARTLQDRLDRSRGRRFGRDEVGPCEQIAAAVRAAREQTTEDLHERFGEYVRDADRVVGTARAAWRRMCLAGHRSDVPCTADAGRVRLRLIRAGGVHEDLDVGCTWHVAVQWARSSGLAQDRVLIGPPAVADRVQALGAALDTVARRQAVCVEQLTFAGRQAAAAAAGCADIVAAVACCPTCNTEDGSERALNEGWCGVCGNAPGRPAGDL